MIPLISMHQIQMTMGSKLLFSELSLGFFENEKVGLIGPNGAGKSTLLKIIAGKETPDEGEVNVKRNLKVSYLAQNSQFNDQDNVLAHIKNHLMNNHASDELDAEVQASIQLSLAGFEDMEQKIYELSGGWRKRLAIATNMAEEPDMLLLDEPTNHMDFDGVLWLEETLKSYKKAFILISHDRDFLNRLTNRTLEISAMYADGYLSFNTSYYDFLERKSEYVEAQMNLQKTLTNKAKREIDWLRAGVKARTTKSSSRMKDAYELIDKLGDVKTRNQTSKNVSKLELDETQRRSKKLIELTDLSVGYPDTVLIKDLNLILGPKFCLGVLGSNGSGKTSFLKTVQGKIEPLAGTIKRADDLKIIYFDQKREALPQDINLMNYLGDGSDHVVFKDNSISVASYASRFLFSSDKLNMKIGHLSGGEQARLMVAKLFLKPVDVLILDEPTNDLDIDTIEVIENLLMDFGGLLILVSHDRKFLNELCHQYLALSANGEWSTYADLEQWLKDKANSESYAYEPEKSKSHSGSGNSKESKPKLSYNDKKALETMEEDIAQAELALIKATKNLENFKNHDNKEKLNKKIEDVTVAQKKLDDLFAYWDELEKKS